MGNLCLCATEYCPEEEKGCKEGGVTTYTLIWSFLLCALKGTKMQTMKRLSTFQAQDFCIMSRVNYLNFEGTLETGFFNYLFKILPVIFCMPLQTASTHYKCHHLRKPGKNGSNSVGIFFFFPSIFHDQKRHWILHYCHALCCTGQTKRMKLASCMVCHLQRFNTQTMWQLIVVSKCSLHDTDNIILFFKRTIVKSQSRKIKMDTAIQICKTKFKNQSL